MYPAFSYVEFHLLYYIAFLILKPEKINLKYLTALLNSKLIYFGSKARGRNRASNYKIDKEPLMEIPLLKAEEKEQEKLLWLLIKSWQKTAEFNKTSQKTDKWHLLKTEIEKLNREIDEAIYKLYGLTEEEIKIIEGNIKKNFTEKNFKDLFDKTFISDTERATKDVQCSRCKTKNRIISTEWRGQSIFIL